MLRALVTCVIFLVLVSHNTTSEAQQDSTTANLSARFGLSGYGSINYFVYDWDSDPTRRNSIDVERLVLYPAYHFSEKIALRGEIEFEHGGTGVTKEFDRFEEFGEFETEVEAGGEVLLEQMYVNFSTSDRFGIRIGRFKIPFGIASYNDEPVEYFTTTRSPAEVAVIPTNWYEVGIQAYGHLGPLGYSASIVNGLDATGFSSASWIVRGNQKRFEHIFAENFAVALRLDWFYLSGNGSRIGLSFYRGDSAENRPKPDHVQEAVVTVLDGHATYERGPIRARALILHGHLQNADLVTQANRNLSNNLNVKRTPVATRALAYYVEGGYNILSLIGVKTQRLDVFLRYAFYDTMFRVEEKIFDNPRWERTSYTGGVNWHIIDQIVLKAEFSHRVLGTSRENVENTFSTGLGFEF